MSQWRKDGTGRLVPSTHVLPHGADQSNALGDSSPQPVDTRPTFGEGLTRAQRKNRDWLTSTIRPMLALDQLDPEDLKALPPGAREKAKAMARQCGELREAGAYGQARQLAEESAVILEGMLPEGWSPPAREDDDPGALAALVRGN